ncbi:MAG: glycosyltransferase family 2 protein [Planctomycetota bacterium]
MIAFVTGLCFWVALISCIVFLFNQAAFRRAPEFDWEQELPSLSILIPARDESEVIENCVRRALDSHGCDFEVIVLDDHSQDKTATLVEALAGIDDRVKLIRSGKLPEGWCGKQFACWQLAALANNEYLLFIDADVELESDAAARSLAKAVDEGTGLLSGFPRQLTGTRIEQLLVPQMYLVLLTYLPFVLMRQTGLHAAAAGCGQFMLCRRGAYQKAGGHQAIRESMHDGLRLPRAFREAGLRTDVFDASDIASCRMYEGFEATWQGLAKNAHEGIANPSRIVPFTILMTLAFVLPPVLVIVNLLYDQSVGVALLATFFSLIPWTIVGWRFNWVGRASLMLPVAVTLFLVNQWQALYRRRRGQRSSWRGREY